MYIELIKTINGDGYLTTFSDSDENLFCLPKHADEVDSFIMRVKETMRIVTTDVETTESGTMTERFLVFEKNKNISTTTVETENE